MKPPVVLFVAANPLETSDLKLQTEAETIAARLASGTMKFVPKFATTWPLLIDALTELKPDIVHFSGHGTPTDKIVLQRDDGRPHPIDGEVIAKLFADTPSTRPRLLVFNACYTLSTARQTREYIDCAIGTTNAIGDKSAITFAGRLYKMLSRGKSVKEAFDTSKNELLGNGDVNHAVFAYEYRPSIDPATVVFVDPTTPADAGAPRVPAQQAFIVQAVGEVGSETRRRADRVMLDLIQPACDQAGYEPVRAHELPSPKLIEPILSALFTQALVIADLGAQPWNSNVMIEVGFRLSTGRPIVLLIDTQTDPDKQVVPLHLPLHLQDRRHLHIDPAAPSDALPELLKHIQASHTDASEKAAWESQHAYVDFQLALEANRKSVYLYANDKAARLYGLGRATDIIGHCVDEVDGHLCNCMDPDFREAFLRDQKQIMADIIPALGRQQTWSASVTVPLWLSRHPLEAERGKFYLPILVQHKYDPEDHSIVMRVSYVDITSWRASDAMTRRPAEFTLPSMFRERREYQCDVFMCYDSDDFRQACTLRSLLRRVGFRVWWPSEEHDAKSDRVLSQRKLAAALSGSRIAAVLLGAKGRGRWEHKEKLNEALFAHCQAKKPLVLFLLPEYDDDASDVQLGPTYSPLVDEPLYVRWTSEDDGQAAGPADRPKTFSERVLTELVKLLGQ